MLCQSLECTHTLTTSLPKQDRQKHQAQLVGRLCQTPREVWEVRQISWKRTGSPVGEFQYWCAGVLVVLWEVRGERACLYLKWFSTLKSLVLWLVCKLTGEQTQPGCKQDTHRQCFQRNTVCERCRVSIVTLGAYGENGQRKGWPLETRW